jgi:tetratricopeptide (TPR) repeat protein
LTDQQQERSGYLLAKGWRLLGEGRAREARAVFGRLHFQDPDHPDAREGMAQAQAAEAEAGRALEAQLAEARRRLDEGDRGGARARLEAFLDLGGDPEEALPLLDRVDGRSGRIDDAVLAARPAAQPPPSARPARRWSRRLLIGAWALAFALLAAGVGSSWERLVGTLVQTPTPSTQPGPVPGVPALQAAGERALAEARRHLQRGDTAAALEVLDRIAPADPAYPFARRIRALAEAARRAEGHRP